MSEAIDGDWMNSYQTLEHYTQVYKTISLFSYTWYCFFFFLWWIKITTYSSNNCRYCLVFYGALLFSFHQSGFVTLSIRNVAQPKVYLRNSFCENVPKYIQIWLHFSKNSLQFEQKIIAHYYSTTFISHRWIITDLIHYKTISQKKTVINLLSFAFDL